MSNKQMTYIIYSCMLLSCNGIEGKYVANYGKECDSLQIFPNHKYNRKSCLGHPGIKLFYEDSGRWNVREGVIWFWNWHDRNNDGEEPFVFGAEIRRNHFIGKQMLLVNDDLGYYYIKY